MIGDGIVILCGYLLGSIPFGYLAGRLRGIDLRDHGSGNTGGTNAVRVLGPKLGVPVMVLDVLKGACAVWLAGSVGGVDVAVIAAAAAVIGHTFPVFLGFGGGKGAATGAGATFALAPAVALVALPVWFGVLLLTGYVSLASVVTAVVIPATAFALGEPLPVRLFTLAAAALVIWRHRANVRRLLAGTEHRSNVRGWWARRAAARSG